MAREALFIEKVSVPTALLFASRGDLLITMLRTPWRYVISRSAAWADDISSLSVTSSVFLIWAKPERWLTVAGGHDRSWSFSSPTQHPTKDIGYLWMPSYAGFGTAVLVLNMKKLSGIKCHIFIFRFGLEKGLIYQRDIAESFSNYYRNLFDM